MKVMNETRHTSKEPRLAAGRTSPGLPEFPHGSNPASPYDEEIHKRAETITLLLKGIRDFQTESRWKTN